METYRHKCIMVGKGLSWEDRPHVGSMSPTLCHPL